MAGLRDRADSRARFPLSIAGVLLCAALQACVTTGGEADQAAAGLARSDAAAGVAALDGGSSPPAAVSSAAAARKPGETPGWLTQFPSDSNYFIGIAGSPDTGNPSEDIAKAQKNARTALASEIETTIKSDTRLSTRDNSKGDTEDSLTMLIDERVNLRLSGIQLVDSFHSAKWGYWFYYRLPRSALDPGPIIARAADDLAAQLHHGTVLSLGSITYADTGLSSGFSLYLQDQLLLALVHEKNISIAIASATPAAKEASDSSQPAATPPPGASAGTATSDAAGSSVGALAPAGAPTDAPTGAILTGTFFGRANENVTAFLRITDGMQHTVLAESSLTLDPSQLPPSLTILPPNFSTAIAAKNEIASLPIANGGVQAAPPPQLQPSPMSPSPAISPPSGGATASGSFATAPLVTSALAGSAAATSGGESAAGASLSNSSGGLQIRVWTDRGDGGTYLDGEDLVVDFEATANCFVKVYHIDVNGQVSLILPNRFSQDNYFEAGHVYRIPAAGASYRFLLGKPYGVEFIKVLASTLQFSDIEQSFADLGQATRSLLTRGLTVVGAGTPQMAQAMVSYTILGRRE